MTFTSGSQRSDAWQVIHLHPQAPPKPLVGEHCNGCGLCCLAEPCPLGMILSRQRRGTCKVLRWDDQAHRYLCGAMGPDMQAWPLAVRWLAPVWQRLARRWIAAGHGCDADFRVERG